MTSEAPGLQGLPILTIRQDFVPWHGPSRGTVHLGDTVQGLRSPWRLPQNDLGSLNPPRAQRRVRPGPELRETTVKEK